MAVNGKVKKSENKTANKGIMTFFKNAKAEFKRITWAPKKDVKKALGAVTLCCTFYVLLISLCDSVFMKMFGVIFGQ